MKNQLLILRRGINVFLQKWPCMMIVPLAALALASTFEKNKFARSHVSGPRAVWEYQTAANTSGWISFDERDFLFVYEEGYSWYEAKWICSSFTNRHGRGSLATINSREVEEFMYSHTSSGRLYYVGLKVKGNVVNCTSDSCYYWQSGDSVEYSNWVDGEPNNNRQLEFCGELFNEYEVDGVPTSGWNDCLCDKQGKRHFICEWRSYDVTCPSSSWDGRGDRCYWFDHVSGNSFNSARRMCEALVTDQEGTATLASITSEEMNNFFLSNTENSSTLEYWTGGALVGDFCPEPDCYYWTNGDYFNYTSWADGQPNNSPISGGEGCISYQAHNLGRWNDLNCSINYNWMGYVCEWTPLTMDGWIYRSSFFLSKMQ